MNLARKFSMAIQLLVASGMVAALVVACGGGSSGGLVQVYTATAGVGEVLQISVDTGNMAYTYQVKYTGYGASGVVAGQSGTGALLAPNADGSYNLGQSVDGFILAGKVLPMQSGLLAGHLQIAPVGGANNIPVFGVANPITTLSALAGVYTYQGFSCAARGISNALGNSACSSQAGTVRVDATGAFTLCKGGDINTSPGVNPCASSSTGSVGAAAGTPGVFDFLNAAKAHIGWFFAFNAPNGKKIAVIDHDDAVSVPSMFGHSILTTYASAVSGAFDGTYLVSNNEGGELTANVAASSLTLTAGSSVTGTMTLNSPWPGLSAYQFAASGALASSGVAMTAGTGVYTYTNRVDSAVFGVGVRY